MNPTFLFPVMGKIVSRRGALALLWQPVKEKENFKFSLLNFA